jgi:Prephenate dehydrogenase
LWGQIFSHNREEVVRALTGLEEELQKFKSALLNEDEAALHRHLTRGKEFRDQL